MQVDDWLEYKARQQLGYKGERPTRIASLRTLPHKGCYYRGNARNNEVSRCSTYWCLQPSKMAWQFWVLPVSAHTPPHKGCYKGIAACHELCILYLSHSCLEQLRQPDCSVIFLTQAIFQKKYEWETLSRYKPKALYEILYQFMRFKNVLEPDNIYQGNFLAWRG